MKGKQIKKYAEQHRSGRSNWLRAAVLGSNDAIVSTASLMVGIAATRASHENIVMTGIAGLVAGALSMAAGEYVSVSSQRDAERADIKREKDELETQPEFELRELAAIYVRRGLKADLALEVARQMTAFDKLGSHLRDELGINPNNLAHPVQAAWVSAVSFAIFAAIPILFLVMIPNSHSIMVISLSSMCSLVGLGALGAYLGGAPVFRATLRVMFGGLLALSVSALIGNIMGVAL